MIRIFDIKRYAIHDGPGIRTTIFLKGCPLSCIWCHNPEGISPQKEMLFTRHKCISCGNCQTACRANAILFRGNNLELNRKICKQNGDCAEICPTLAIEMSGKDLSIEDLMTEIDKETIVMDKSSGGVTLCGGEPLMFPEQAIKLLSRCKSRGIHRVVDTSLYVSSRVLTEIVPLTSLFLVDLKHMDSKKHHQFTGVHNERILRNIQILSEMNADFIIRIPLIDGFNADEINITNSAKFLDILPWERRTVELLPYHEIGIHKHARRQTTSSDLLHSLKTPQDDLINSCIDIFKRYGIQASI